MYGLRLSLSSMMLQLDHIRFFTTVYQKLGVQCYRLFWEIIALLKDEEFGKSLRMNRQDFGKLVYIVRLPWYEMQG